MVSEVGSNVTRLVVLSGLSGAGKTIALRTLEDFDYYCVDNLPAALMPALVNAVSIGGHRRIAVGVDVRNRAEDLNLLPEILAELARSGVNYQLIFLDTRDDVLVKRFSDTRRRHPLSAEGLPLHDAIALERKLLRPLSAIADRVIDSSELNVHQLRRPSWAWPAASCHCCLNPSPTSAACRSTRISCSMRAVCRTPIGTCRYVRSPAKTALCANGWKAKPR
jgi:hypothetical protein